MTLAQCFDKIVSSRVRASTVALQRCVRGGTRFLATFSDAKYGTMPEHNSVTGHAHSMSSTAPGGLSLVNETGTGLKAPPGWNLSCISTAGFKAKGIAGNQDAFSYTTLDSGWQLAVVCDGHGEQGDVAATRVARLLPYILARVMAKGTTIREALEMAFLEANEDLVHGATVQGDFSQSGTTTTVACIHAERLEAWIAWVGDARGVLGNLEDGRVIFSSRDHKPHDGEEQTRISKTGAHVHTYFDEESDIIHGSRVYDPDTQLGLAMSRSLGDTCFNKCGVIPDPDIIDVSAEWSKCHLPIFCLASDGLWGYMESDEVMHALTERRASLSAQRGLALEALCWSAQQRWFDAEETGYCDDITIFCIVPPRT